MKNFIFASILAVSSVVIVQAEVGNSKAPDDLVVTHYAGPDMTPSPAVICASASGEVYVGVDMQGSLGKKLGLGRIIKLIDADNDGKADKSMEYAKVDNPRGLIAIGDQLYCLHCTVGPDGKVGTQQLSVYVDADNDGVADGPPKALVTNIGNPKFLKSRGTDHSTNNIRLAIDGWIYISVGDFGFVGAEGADGVRLDMHGGGIVRVRPDGSELETFIQGTRNVYDVAIDPFMNIFTRENTNDGVGWWTRFSHYIQTGEYGYPSLYTNFPEDIIPALGEYGSGSGTGNIFFQEPGWPEKYNNTAMMADWGRSQIFIHRLEKDGASFTDKPEEFISSPQVSDLDVDGSGRMYIAAWDGASYTGSPKKGFISRVVPKSGWVYKEFPTLTNLGNAELVKGLMSDSATTRMYMQQEILRRNDKSMAVDLYQLAEMKDLSLESRVASVYTLAQLKGDDALDMLVKLAESTDLREHAIRSMADRISIARKADVELLSSALRDHNPRVKVAAAIALGRTGDLAAADALLAVANPTKIQSASVSAPKKSKVIRGRETVKIEQDISGYATLCLIVNEEGDNKNDHAAWVDPVVTLKDGNKLQLTQRKWQDASQGWGEALVNKTCTGMRLRDVYGKPVNGIGTHAKSFITYEIPKNAVKFTATGMLSNPAGKVSFTVSDQNPAMTKKLHSTPNPEILLPHVARQALVALEAEDACIAALNSDNEQMRASALVTMKFMHSDKVVDALIAAGVAATGAEKMDITHTLIRLHQREADYDGSTWWSTRPDPTGPYYYPVDWAASDKISAYLTDLSDRLEGSARAELKKEIVRNRAYVDGINPRPVKKEKVAKTVEKTSIEDLVIYVSKNKGDATRGAKVIGKVGCAGCHNVKAGEVVKGPDLTQLGGLSRTELTEALIKPNATIAKSWVNVVMEDGSAHLGTMVKKDDKEIIIHNIAGIPTKLDVTKVKEIAPGMGMMSLHLCDNLSLAEFADLIAYLHSMDVKFEDGE